MANKQIIDFNLESNPSAEDYFLLQDKLNNTYKKIMLADLAKRKATIQFVIGSGSGVPSTGIVGHIYLPLDTKIEIKGWRLSSHNGNTGSIQIDLWHDQNRAAASNDDSICGAGNEPTLSDQSEDSDTDISASWNTTTLVGGCLVVNLDSVSTLTQVTLCLDIEISPYIEV
jgi:hypothetical protein